MTLENVLKTIEKRVEDLSAYIEDRRAAKVGGTDDDYLVSDAYIASLTGSLGAYQDCLRLLTTD